jgi:hypothetical protein
MTSRSKRGIRRASTRIRLAVAAAVLVGGGAVGAVAVAASHSGGTVAAASAGYSHRALTPQEALSSAMNGWNRSPSNSLATLTKMTPMRNFEMMAYHKHTIALQRGIVLAAERNAFVIKSANHQLELWYVNRGTKFFNVGPSNVGMQAMTGGTMFMPDNMNMNMRARVLAQGDFVFIFGDKVDGKLIAQLVLFVAPIKVNVTPTQTMPATQPATSTWTPTPGWTASPTATAPMSLPTHS